VNIKSYSDLANPDDHITITRPFAIFVEPASCGWVASLVGYNLDHCTQGDSPEHAVEMMADVIRILTGKEGT
jgi:predicted RNase H-like HicB family nuclease